MLLRRYHPAAEAAASPEPDAETQTAETGVQPDPRGTVDQVMAYVGDDPDRAAEALARERDKGDKARVTLVSQLEPMVEDTGQDAEVG